jgi:membrane protease YdiL (CAAX protease family)
VSDLATTCQSCAKPLKPGAKFCGGCGAFVARPSASLPIPSIHDVAGEGGGLPAALIPYLACLAVSAGMLLGDDIDVDALRNHSLIILAIGAVGFAFLRRPNLPLLRPPRLDWRWTLGLLGGAVGFALVVSYTFNLLPESWVIEETWLHKAAGASFALVVLDFAVLPAIGEELVFRGVILSGLRGVFRDHTAAVISALMFATLHVSPISFLHLAILGYVFARLRLATNSIWPAVVLHLLYNATILGLQW